LRLPLITLPPVFPGNQAHRVGGNRDAATMEKMNIEEISRRLKPIFKKNNVEKVIVFGSGARGTHTRRSDLDLLIVLKTDKRFFARYEDFEEIGYLLKGRNVDMLIYSPEELENISHRKFIKTILSEGRIVYEH